MKSLTAIPVAFVIFLIMAVCAVLSAIWLAVHDTCHAVDRKIDRVFQQRFFDW